MPLNFPENPVAGQGYQSGSTEPYQYNGSYWESIAGSSVMIVQQGVSASYTPVHRRNVTAVSAGAYGNALIIADGKVFSHNTGNGGVVSRTGGVYSTYVGVNTVSSPEFMYEIAFPTETGTLVEANIYNTSAYALFNNGNLYTWGNNQFGQLGTGDFTFRGLPTLVQTGVSKVYWHPSQNQGVVDYASLFIRKTDGKVYATGYNGQGQLGLGDNTSRSSFTEVTGIGTNPLYVGVCGGYVGWVIAQKSDATVVAAGWNNNGQLGDGSTTQRTSFVTASGWLHGTSSMRIVDHVAGVANDSGNSTGNCQFWLSNGVADNLMGTGYPEYGSIADAGTGTTAVSTPLRATGVPITKRIQKLVRVGNTFGTCHALTTDGVLYGWGWNDVGQMGNGSTTKTATPTLIMTGALDIDSGMASWYFGTNQTGPIVRNSDGYYYSWGLNSHGMIGDGTTANRSSPVKIRFTKGATFKFFTSITTSTDTYTRIAIGSDNRYYCWADNSARAVDTNNTDDILTPTEFSPRVLQR